MKVVHIRAIDGPNVYIHKPVLVMRLDLEEYTDRDSYEFPGFAERLLQICPGLYEHHCAMGHPGGFVERLFGGTYMGHIVEHVALELLTQIGYHTNFGKTRNAGAPGLYDVVIEYESELPSRAILATAVELVRACAHGEYYPLKARLEEAQRLRVQSDLGPSTSALMTAAVTRGIPVRRIGVGSLLQLGTGRYQKYVQAAMTKNTSAVAVDIASDKALTKEILATAGIRVPIGGVAKDPEEATSLFTQLQRPVVVKPLDGSKGRGVSIDLHDMESVRAAFYLASQFSEVVVVEEFVQGRQYRLLIVGQRLAAAAERIPAHVIGDGVHSIGQLIEWVNQQPDRGDDHEKPLTRIKLDEVAQRYLVRRGRTLFDIPLQGELVMLRDSANLSTGGIAIDVTREVHPSYAALAVRAARAIGLDVCGIDVVTPDICQPLASTSGAVIEVNAAPGIRMHHFPSAGQSRDVAADIIETLFPKGSRVRIPVIAITGTNGKTSTTRMIGHMLATNGLTVGMTTTDGIFIDGVKVQDGDTTGPQSARLILSDPTVDVAILETARGGIMRGGLAYGVADVGILTNVTVDHLGQDGLQTIEDIIRVKSLVAECLAPGGIAVLNADDDELVKLVGRLKGKVVFTSTQEKNAVVTRHLARGGTAYFVKDGWLIEAAGALEWKVVRVEELPITLHGAAWFHVSNALNAIAAARHVGTSREHCAQALSRFRSDTHNPGRVNIFKMPSGTHLIADYGHNPDGIRAVGQMVARLLGRKVPAVIGFPGDRADEVVREAARLAALYFDPLLVKEDGDTRGRRRGEMADLIVDEIRQCSPNTTVSVELGECSALACALRTYPDAPLLLMFHEELGPVKRIIEEHGGQEVYDIVLGKIPAITAM